MKKTCSRCGLQRDAEKDFSWKRKDQGIRANRCKYCQSELSRQHYQKDKQSYNRRTQIRKAKILRENHMYIRAYLSTHPCIDCGKKDIRTLEFDHVRETKAGEISDMLRQGNSWSTIESEIAKCEIRCANCHRIRTLEHCNSWRNKSVFEQQNRSYMQVYNYLAEHPCIDCNEADIRLLNFVHVRGSKVSTISRLLIQGCKWSTIEAEISKCEIRCANCHAIKSH